MLWQDTDSSDELLGQKQEEEWKGCSFLVRFRNTTDMKASFPWQKTVTHIIGVKQINCWGVSSSSRASELQVNSCPTCWRASGSWQRALKSPACLWQTRGEKQSPFPYPAKTHFQKDLPQASCQPNPNPQPHVSLGPNVLSYPAAAQNKTENQGGKKKNPYLCVQHYSLSQLPCSMFQINSRPTVPSSSLGLGAGFVNRRRSRCSRVVWGNGRRKAMATGSLHAQGKSHKQWCRVHKFP